jgi:DNA ligase-1
MGRWDPVPETFQRILSPDIQDADISRPYPFYLAYPLEEDVRGLGRPKHWQVEWKWDGIRGQLVKRKGQVFIWSRGEELVTDKYPELAAAAEPLPDGTALDGEILPWKEGRPLPFSVLQKRIGRKKVSPKILAAAPVILVVYDLLEHCGRDMRQLPLRQRRTALEALLAPLDESRIMLSPLVAADSWDALETLRKEARSRNVEGFMLKRQDSVYGVGRRRGRWWKWKVDPLTADGVLVYAQRGHGRRSGLYTDYTFAVWDHQTLVPFAKAYSGLSDAEIRRVDRFVQRNTIERFGPVRAVKPELVFEIAFEGIQSSPRHKSGVAVRFPRIARWRADKKVEEADSLQSLRDLLAAGTT